MRSCRQGTAFYRYAAIFRRSANLYLKESIRHSRNGSLEKRGGIIIGGDNYGQGSSREHAALAPRYLGVTVKITKAFARIHKANLINFGIIPLVFADPKDYDSIAQGDILTIPGIRAAIESGKSDIIVTVKERKIITRLDVSDRQRQVLLAGGVLNQVKP